MFSIDSEPERRRVLVVEDDDGVRRSLHLLLTWRGFDVQTFPDAETALRAGAFDGAAGAVLDYRLPGGDGLDLLHGLRAAGWTGRAVLITGHGSDRLFADARERGFDAVLDKPLREHELIRALAV